MATFGELFAALETMEFEGSGFLRLIGGWEMNDDLHVTFDLFLDQGSPARRWEVRARNVGKACLMFGEVFHDVELLEDHPLLWPHARPSASLFFYFADGVESPSAVTTALYERHQELTDGWLPFEDFVNASAHTPLSRLIANRYGTLAKGPTPLLEAYAGVLHEHGATASNVLPIHPPRYWDGEKWIEEHSDLSVCILGDSYVIAPDFDARELS